MNAPAAPTFGSHGAAVPALGFGTSPLAGSLSAASVLAALAAGYRHIDTARKYGTERPVGEAIRASAVPREEIFLTTKVSHENLRADDFARSVDESLEALKVDYVDLLLVHWPNPQIALSETMPVLAKAKTSGLTRHIGVANFNITLLDEAIRLCPEPLVALQAEYHPISTRPSSWRQRASGDWSLSPIARWDAGDCSMIRPSAQSPKHAGAASPRSPCAG